MSPALFVEDHYWLRVKLTTFAKALLVLISLSPALASAEFFCTDPGSEIIDLFYQNFPDAFKACADDQNASFDGVFHRSCVGNTFQSEFGLYAVESVQIGSLSPCKHFWYPNDVCPPDQIFVGPAAPGHCAPPPPPPCGKDCGAGSGPTPLCPLHGNPCNSGTGNKYQVETDLESHDGRLSFIRYYNSVNGLDLGLGFGWSATPFATLRLDPQNSNSLRVQRPDGRSEPFTKTPDGIWQGDSDTKLKLVQDSTGFTLFLRDASSERYDQNGNLIAYITPAGLTTHYTYSNNKLIGVSGPFGHVLSFNYDGNGHIQGITDTMGQTTAYGYDDSGNLTQVTYPDGGTKRYLYENSAFPHKLTGVIDENATHFATYGYDDQGRAVLTQHAVTTNGAPQERFSFSYDSDNQTTVIDPAGVVSIEVFVRQLGAKQMTRRTNQQDGKTASVNLDSNNNVVSFVNEEGQTTTYTYNVTNQRLSETQASGTPQARITTYQYLSDIVNLPTLIRRPSIASGQSQTTAITYDGQNNPIRIVRSGFTPSGEPVTRTTVMSYTSLGQLSEIDGPRDDVNDVTRFEYYACTTGGACGQLRSVTNALGHVTTYDAYDANGRLQQMTEPNGLKTNYNYDPRGRLITLIQQTPNGAAHVTHYVYDKVGQLVQSVGADGSTLTYTFDVAHNLAAITDNLGNTTRYLYDLKGNRVVQNAVNPDGTTVSEQTLAYDLRNRVVQINNGGSLSQQVRDALGNLLNETNPRGNTSSNQYDALNRLLQTFDSLGGVTRYTYNMHDELVQMATPNGATTSYLYDDLGNLLQERSPDRGTVTYTYDAAGNLTSQTDARGITASYTYDELNRLTTIHYSSTGVSGVITSILIGSPEDVTYVYDQESASSTTGVCSSGIGRLCEVQDQSGVTRYAYDGFGNLIAQLHTELNVTYATRYVYDAANRISAVTYPDGRVIEYARNSIGQIQGVSATINNSAQTITSDRRYRADGLLTNETKGNGLNEVREYDLQGRLTDQTIGDNADTRNYVYDPNGNLVHEVTSTQLGSYAYDALDRLTQELLSTAGVTSTENFAYTYDPNGNRLSDLKANGKIRPFTYAADSNRLMNVGNQTVTLDAAGNTTSDRGGDRVFTYSLAGRLAQVMIKGVLKGTYVYNAYGQRTEKIKNGTTIIYHYDINGNLISETKPDGTPIRSYIYAESQPLAQIQFKPKQDTLVYIHTDHLNTPRLATDNSQVVVWRWDSEAFGTGRPDTDPDEDDTKINIRLRFPGQYFDEETGLIYNWNRYYDPKPGRYITSDPMGLRAGLNPYVYVNNNALRWVDPFGLCTCRFADKNYSSERGFYFDRFSWLPYPNISGRFACIYTCEDDGQSQQVEGYVHEERHFGFTGGGPDAAQQFICKNSVKDFIPRKDLLGRVIFYDPVLFGDFDPRGSGIAGLEDWAKQNCKDCKGK